MKYALVTGDGLTEFSPVVFTYDDGKYEVLCEQEERRKNYYDHIKNQNYESFEAFLSTFSYQNVESGEVEGKKKNQIDKIRDRFAGGVAAKIIVDKALKNPINFDPDAVDADDDGRVQDGTPFERPAVAARASRLMRRVRGGSAEKRTVTDVSNDDFKQAQQRAITRARGRASSLDKPARRMFSGRQRSASQRRKLLDGSTFAEYPGVRRLFKNRDDAYDDLKESTVRTLADMKALAVAGQLRGKDGRRLDERTMKYIAQASPEKMWDDLENTAIQLNKALEKMPVEIRTKADISEMIINQGLLGDPQNRVKRPDMKTPWIMSVLSEHGHQLSDEDKRMLEMNGLLVPESSRGTIYESLRELLEQGMGFNGAGDRNGRPVYGYFVTPSPKSTEENDNLSEVGKRLKDSSNGPNLTGYSDSSLVRMRETVKDRTGFTYGDSLRNGILPARVGTTEDKDTVLAVVHDRDFTDTKVPSGVASEMREVQQDYLLGLMEWRLSGDSSNLTRSDYIEAIMPNDVSPEEIEEMVVATDKLSVFRSDLDDAASEIMAAASAAQMRSEEYEKLLTFLTEQSDGWSAQIKATGGNSEIAQFSGIDPLLKSILQLSKGKKIKKAGEEAGIKMLVGPSSAGTAQVPEDAIEALIRRFNP